jgi:hypothetical protein
MIPPVVIPAKAGIQFPLFCWMPASAGMAEGS